MRFIATDNSFGTIPGREQIMGSDSNRFKLSYEQADAIMAKVSELTVKKAFSLHMDSERKPSIFDSKFGGIPYWDSSKEYPTAFTGEKLMLLAQINLEDIGENDLLPDSGLLQFFVLCDDVYGCSFGDIEGADGFAVVWHEKVDRSVTPEDVLALEIPTSDSIMDDDILTPIKGECAVKIECTEVPMGMEVIGFDELFRKNAAELGIDIPEEHYICLVLPDEWCEANPEPNIGHWMLGYPYFTQFDPRYKEELQRYDTLLLQIDSDCNKDGSCEIMWGDSGVAGFFINEDDLKERNFARILYTWDCC